VSRYFARREPTGRGRTVSSTLALGFSAPPRFVEQGVFHAAGFFRPLLVPDHHSAVPAPRAKTGGKKNQVTGIDAKAGRIRVAGRPEFADHAPKPTR